MDVGDVAEVEVRFAIKGVLTDPDIVTFSVWKPGTPDTGPADFILTYDSGSPPTGGPVTRSSTGVYVGEFDVDVRGRWRVKMRGSSPAKSGTSVTFFAFD